MILYHAYESHYDLLVYKESNLAVNGSVTKMLKSVGIDKARDEPINDDVFNDHVVDVLDPPVDDVFSPLVFKPCPKGPGRPKTKRVGQPNIPKKTTTTKKRLLSDAFDEPAVAEEPIQKKKRGRPAGSKNKPKDKETKEKEPKKTLRQRAEEAAATKDDDGDLFADSKDVCPICDFLFHHPLKSNKPRTRCTECGILVHKPCLEKSGCIC